MLKKTAILGAGLALVLGLVFGRSHVLTTVGLVKQSVKDSVPIEFELKRARQLITELEPEIRRNMHLIAKEEVEVEKLAKAVADNNTQLTKSREEIVRLKNDLDRGESTFVYAGRSYSAKQVKTDLTNRFARYETRESALANNEKVLNARQKGLAAARQNLEEMLASKSRLEVEIENLEARLKMVEVAQTKSNFSFDDSRLSHTKELISDIQARIEVAERMVDAEGQFHDEIPLETVADEDISRKIAEKFGSERAEIEALARTPDTQ
jgi:chromosome segregation ATPase